ncbi:hypothetical protein, partial [Escherichia coli]|uniref:hypothetical protein n=1 Tax=Escherichia coli TaxID=562 RepID=UPI001953E911
NSVSSIALAMGSGVVYVLLSVGIVLSLFIPFIQGMGSALMDDISVYSVVHARTVWGTSFLE